MIIIYRNDVISTNNNNDQIGRSHALYEWLLPIKISQTDFSIIYIHLIINYYIRN